MLIWFVLIVILFFLIFLLKNKIEQFGELSDTYLETTDLERDKLMNNMNPTTVELINSIEKNKDITDIQNPNFNNLNNLPFLINPQDKTKGYYFERVKLITNQNSELIQKSEKNMNKINKLLNKCSNDIVKNNSNFVHGFNKFEDLRNDSYANVTSIGKSLLTPYTSFPVPS